MSEEQRGTVKAKTYSVPRSAIPHAPDGDGYYVTVVELTDYMACLNRITEMSVENYHMKNRIAELESALNRHYELPDVYDMAIKQFESLAKSEYIPVHINYQCAICDARFSGGIPKNNHKRRCYTTGAKIFIAVYLLALAAAIAGVVHYV